MASYLFEKTYICDYSGCEKVFPTRFSLKRHTLIHSKIKKHECRFCHKKFALIQYLQEHEYTHTGERPYVCGVGSCAKSFRQRAKLSLHKRTHPEFTIKKYKLHTTCSINEESEEEISQNLEKFELLVNERRPKNKLIRSACTQTNENPNQAGDNKVGSHHALLQNRDKKYAIQHISPNAFHLEERGENNGAISIFPMHISQLPEAIALGNNQGLSMPGCEYLMQPLNRTNNDNFLVAGVSTNGQFIVRQPANLPCQPYQAIGQLAQNLSADMWSSQFSNQNSFAYGGLPIGALMVRAHPSLLQTTNGALHPLFQQSLQLSSNPLTQSHSSGIWNSNAQRPSEERREFISIELREPQNIQRIEERVKYEIKNEFSQRI